MHLFSNSIRSQQLFSKTSLLLLIIIIFTFFIRIFSLGSYPANINPDEADNIQTYVLAQETGHPTVFEFNWNGASAVNTYILGIFWELADRDIWGIRFASAMISSITVAVFFITVLAITRNISLAMLSSLLLATNPWFLNFSRSGWENAWVTLPVIGIAYGLYKFDTETDKKTSITILITLSVIAFYGYHPGKLLGIATTTSLVGITSHKRDWISLRFITIFALLVTALTIPNVISTYVNEYAATARVKDISIFNSPDPSIFFAENVINNALGFTTFHADYFQGYLNDRYAPNHESLIHPLLTVLYVIGFLVAVKKHTYLPIFFLIALLPVQLLSKDTPDAARAIHIAPMIFLFAAIGTNELLSLAKRHFPKHLAAPNLLLVLTFIVISYLQLHSYATWIQEPSTLRARQPAVPNELYDVWLGGVIISSQQKGHRLNESDWAAIMKEYYSTPQQID